MRYHNTMIFLAAERAYGNLFDSHPLGQMEEPAAFGRAVGLR